MNSSADITARLIDRLEALRGRIRRRLVAYGVFVVLSGGAASFLTVVMLDWLLWLPPPLRLLGLALFILGAAAATFHWVIRPVRARLGIEEVSAQIERHFDPLRDRLQSAVYFLENPQAGSPEMLRRMIESTEELVDRMPLHDALTSRPLVARGAVTAASVAILLLILAAAPQWAMTGIQRYARPFGEVEWPRTVSIRPLTGDQTVAVGESVTIRMAVDRGWHENLRALVHLRNSKGGVTTLALQRDPEGAFSAAIDAVTEDVTYWFEAGDDDTERRPSAIRVVRRPEVVEVAAAIEPPPYAPLRGERIRDLAEGPVRATVGGWVRVAVRASKPVRTDDPAAPVGLRTEAGELIPLSTDGDDRTELSARWEVADDLSFRVELRDDDGFENRGSATYSVVASPDLPPVVSFIEPAGLVEVTPRDVLPLQIHVDDDFGVVRVDLEIRPQGGEPQVVSLGDAMEFLQDEQGIRATVRYAWPLEPLGLSPGDTVVFTAAASDNHATPTSTGQTGRSPAMQLKVISEDEFEVRVRSEIALLEARVRQIAGDEAEVWDRTTALITDDAVWPLGDAGRDTAASLVVRQSQIVRKLQEVADRFQSVARRVERSRAGRAETLSRVAALAESLRSIAAGPMTSASAALSRTPEQTDPSEQQRSLAEASRHEETAVERLHAALQVMTQWTSFHELLGKTRDLLGRQNEIAHRTSELGRATLGKPLESLSEGEAAGLKRVGRDQDQLGVDIGQLLERMRQLAASAGQRDRTGAEAIDAALRSAAAHDLQNQLRAASEAIRGNRTSAATIAQKNSADALARMIASLRDRDDRELEELRKRLEEARDQVAALLEHQKTIRQGTEVVGPAEAETGDWENLESEQRTLRRNTRTIGDDLAETERSAAAGRLVRQAVTPMGAAESRLRDRDAPAAIGAQDEAIDLLGQAIARLEEAAEQTEEEIIRRSLAQIREDLEAILAAQRAVHEGVTDLVELVQSQGRVGRPEAHTASRLARDQAEVRSLVDAQVRDFEEVVVYRWALERVAKWMDAARERLDERRLDAELPAGTRRIIRELEKLIRAIVETSSLPADTQFVESDRGGDGHASARPRKPIPTVAELLVLKAMQLDINDRTEALNESLDPDTATEAQLRDLKTLGEDQAEVRRLTGMVIEKVRGQ